MLCCIFPQLGAPWTTESVYLLHQVKFLVSANLLGNKLDSDSEFEDHLQKTLTDSRRHEHNHTHHEKAAGEHRVSDER